MSVTSPEPAASVLSRLHQPTLDGVRGLAILLVLGHNLTPLEAPANLIGRTLEVGLDDGWIGVQLFFVLSGFLITGILLDTQHASNYFKAFFARRALRIFPIYYLSLIVILIVLPARGLGPDVGGTWQHQLPLWLYYSNWTSPYGRGGEALPHFWSLAVEEQFYLAWPLLVHRLTPPQVIKLCITVAGASLLIRIGLLASHAPFEAVYMFTVCRMDALALGGAAAAALRISAWRVRLTEVPRHLFLAGVTVLAGSFVIDHGYPRVGWHGQTVGYSALALGFALLTLACSCADLSHARGLFDVLRVKPLRAMGKYSYGVYIFHKPFDLFIGLPWLASHPGIRHSSMLVALCYIVAGTVASLLMAMLSYRLIEQRFLRLKTRFAVV
jgi:peptidoglycan/LPS O-acetylase OafA/YrhL